jgi:N-acyl-D-amino-acid deacylase
VCFDPETVRDTATYEEPKRKPEGIPYVAVNGRLVVDDGRHTGDLPGRALRRGRPTAG